MIVGNLCSVLEDGIVLSTYFMNIVGFVTFIVDLLVLELLIWIVLFLDTTAGVVALCVVFALEIIVDVDWRVVVVLLCVVLSVIVSLCFVGLVWFVVSPECPVEYAVLPEVNLSVVGNSPVVVAGIIWSTH